MRRSSGGRYLTSLRRSDDDKEADEREARALNYKLGAVFGAKASGV
jgi:hypothetical protein